MMAIDWFINILGSAISICGFDFKKTPTFYTVNKDRMGPHAWDREREMVGKYILAQKIIML